MRRALVLMLFLASPAMADGVLSDLRGGWIGNGLQNGETWEMELQVVPGGARVDYPGISCGGVWVLPDDRENHAEGTEWLTYGQDLCIDALRVVVTAEPGNTLGVRWLENDGSEVATARLDRVGAGSGNGKSAGKRP